MPCPRLASSPPHKVPTRIETKVPASTSALPPTSSSSRRCCGKMAYLTGPKKVDCKPSRKRQAISRGRLCSQKPAATRSMMAISSALTRRASSALSYLSANCPAVAENRKKGRMNKPAARLASSAGERRLHCAVWNVSSTISAFLNRLSLKAPRNCVRKNGLKRRVLSKPNWELMKQLLFFFVGAKGVWCDTVVLKQSKLQPGGACSGCVWAAHADRSQQPRTGPELVHNLNAA